MQAIILAGGFGTRLQSVIPDVPKPMAPIRHKPFLAYLLKYLKQQGFQHVVLSVHYKAEQIKAYFEHDFEGLRISYAVEAEPLGTGGAIIHALQYTRDSEPCFVLNGDTFVEMNYQSMLADQEAQGNNLSVALCYLQDCNRYGLVQFNEEMTITAFTEKGSNLPGWINSGVYLLKESLFSSFKLPRHFSFEKDFLVKYIETIKPRGFKVDDYFIDIGVPEDYLRAENELGSELSF